MYTLIALAMLIVRRMIYISGAVFVVERFQPVPTAYGHVHHRGTVAHIQLGNSGFGPMFVRSLLLKDKSGKTLHVDDVFRPAETDSFVLHGRGGDEQFGDFRASPRLCDKGVVLLSARPCEPLQANAHDATFATDFFAKLNGDDVFMEVKTSCSDRFPLNAFWTTRKLHIMFPPVPPVPPVPSDPLA